MRWAFWVLGLLGFRVQAPVRVSGSGLLRVSSGFRD